MKKKTSRSRAKIKIRKKISGTTEKPRLSVYRSLDNIYAQIIDDTTGNTLVAISSLAKEAKAEVKSIKGKQIKASLSLHLQKALKKHYALCLIGGFRHHIELKL
jgi:large subunit ribosomal protein L18